MNLPKILLTIRRVVVLLAAAATLLAQAPQPAGADPQQLLYRKSIYENALGFGWQDDWSWNASAQYSVASPVYSAPFSLSVTITQAWGALFLHNEYPFSTAGYTHLRFYIHGGSAGGQKIQVVANEDPSRPFAVPALAGAAWSEVNIPLSHFGSPAALQDLYFQGAVNGALAPFYLDDIALVNSNAAIVPRAWVPVISKLSFSTLPPGSKLPSDAECAALVRKRPENKGENADENVRPGSQRLPADFFGTAVDPRANTIIAARVTGNFTGTTDEILQWAACKWGVDENLVRAQAVAESWWRQDALGDWTTNESLCAPGHALGTDDPIKHPYECPESLGLLQTRYTYMKAAWPSMENSSAFNVDLAYGIWRSCYEGYEWWLNDVERGWDYAAGDTDGCLGRWFSGRWHTTSAEGYIQRVHGIYETRFWETENFQEP